MDCLDSASSNILRAVVRVLTIASKAACVASLTSRTEVLRAVEGAGRFSGMWPLARRDSEAESGEMGEGSAVRDSIARRVFDR